MSEAVATIEKRFQLSAERAERLSRLAQTRQLDENRIVEKALDMLFDLADLLDERTERQGWAMLSDASLQRIWDNEKDAAYDNWRELYGVPAG